MHCDDILVGLQSSVSHFLEKCYATTPSDISTKGRNSSDLLVPPFCHGSPTDNESGFKVEDLIDLIKHLVPGNSQYTCRLLSNTYTRLY